MYESKTIATASGPMKLHLARPSQAARRAVIVAHEAFGVNDQIRGVVERFAARGFLAVAPDLFHRSGVEQLAYDQHAEAVALIGGITAADITQDIGAVLDHLAGEEHVPRASTAVVGFCFGGRAAFTAAVALPGLAASVVFYGPGVAAGPHALLDQAGRIRCPMLLHVGADDPLIPAEHREAIDRALSATGVPFEQHVYAGAGHAFANEDRPQMYRADEAGQAWRATDAFLDRHVPA